MATERVAEEALIAADIENADAIAPEVFEVAKCEREELRRRLRGSIRGVVERLILLSSFIEGIGHKSQRDVAGARVACHESSVALLEQSAQISVRDEESGRDRHACRVLDVFAREHRRRLRRDIFGERRTTLIEDDVSTSAAQPIA